MEYEEREKSALQFDLEGDNEKIMKMSGYNPVKGNKRSGWAKVVGKSGERFHAYVYPKLIYIHYDDMRGFKHKTKPHPQLLKGEINRIKEFESITNKYIKKHGGKQK